MSESPEVTFQSPYKTTFGFDDSPSDDMREEVEAPEGSAEDKKQPFDFDAAMLRLMQLQKGFGPTDVASTQTEVGPLGGQFTSIQRDPAPGQGDLNRLVLGAGGTLPNDVRLGGQLLAQQDNTRGGATLARPSLNLGYGPFSLNAGYQAVIPSDARQPAQIAPSYGMNVNFPLAGGELSGGVSQTVGQRDPYMYAAYQLPIYNALFGGNLGLELSSADRLRNLAAMLTYRRVF